MLDEVHTSAMIGLTSRHILTLCEKLSVPRRRKTHVNLIVRSQPFGPFGPSVRSGDLNYVANFVPYDTLEPFLTISAIPNHSRQETVRFGASTLGYQTKLPARRSVAITFMRRNMI